MTEYKTPLGTVVVSKIKDLPIEEIKLGEELWAWYKLNPELYYIEIIPREASIIKSQRFVENKPSLSMIRRYRFLSQDGKNEYDALLKLQKSLKSRPGEMYPQVVLDIINNVVSDARSAT